MSPIISRDPLPAASSFANHGVALADSPAASSAQSPESGASGGDCAEEFDDWYRRGRFLAEAADERAAEQAEDLRAQRDEP